MHRQNACLDERVCQRRNSFAHHFRGLCATVGGGGGATLMRRGHLWCQWNFYCPNIRGLNLQTLVWVLRQSSVIDGGQTPGVAACNLIFNARKMMIRGGFPLMDTRRNEWDIVPDVVRVSRGQVDLFKLADLAQRCPNH